MLFPLLNTDLHHQSLICQMPCSQEATNNVSIETSLLNSDTVNLKKKIRQLVQSNLVNTGRTKWNTESGRINWVSVLSRIKKCQRHEKGHYNRIVILNISNLRKGSILRKHSKIAHLFAQLSQHNCFDAKN